MTNYQASNDWKMIEILYFVLTVEDWLTSNGYFRGSIPAGVLSCYTHLPILPKGILCIVFEKELYKCMANVTLWRVVRKRLHLKAYKLSIVEHFEEG
jgi:hypothetical protein